MTTLHCLGGHVVEIIDTDRWIVPRTSGSRLYSETIDFTRLPSAVRPWWRAVLQASYSSDSLAQAYGIWVTAIWFNRFLQECGTVTTNLDSLTRTEWGLYAQWLDTQTAAHGGSLSHDYRRGQFTWLAAAIRHAIILGFPGVSQQSIQRLSVVSRRAFRGNDALIRRRIEKRTLTSAQYTDLYGMMAEEWQRYKDNPRSADLPALVACWLAFNDGVRSAEINTLLAYRSRKLEVSSRAPRPLHVAFVADTLLHIGSAAG